MALAKTNAALYSVEKTEDTYEANMEPIALEVSADIRNIVSGNGIIVVVPNIIKNTYYSDSTLFVSTNGTDYTPVNMDFVVFDLIYSNKLSKFIAVGMIKNETAASIKTSADGITWESETLCTIQFGKPTCYYAIRESGSGFYVMEYLKSSNATTSYHYSGYVEKKDGSYQASNVVYVGSGYLTTSKAIKGNERTVVNKKVQTGSTITQASMDPVLFVDGYFIYFHGANIYKSLNGVDYSLVGATAYSLKYICKYQGYYYGIAEDHICRATTLAKLCSVASEDYKEIDNNGYNYAAVHDDYMILCASGFLFKTTIGGSSNPADQTIKTISATEALKQAKEYTDAQYALLEARIAALENK